MTEISVACRSANKGMAGTHMKQHHVAAMFTQKDNVDSGNKNMNFQVV